MSFQTVLFQSPRFYILAGQDWAEASFTFPVSIQFERRVSWLTSVETSVMSDADFDELMASLQ